jgi:hypothetical protein
VMPLHGPLPWPVHNFNIRLTDRQDLRPAPDLTPTRASWEWAKAKHAAARRRELQRERDRVALERLKEEAARLRYRRLHGCEEDVVGVPGGGMSLSRGGGRGGGRAAAAGRMQRSVCIQTEQDGQEEMQETLAAAREEDGEEEKDVAELLVALNNHLREQQHIGSPSPTPRPTPEPSSPSRRRRQHQKPWQQSPGAPAWCVSSGALAPTQPARASTYASQSPPASGSPYGHRLQAGVVVMRRRREMRGKEEVQQQRQRWRQQQQQQQPHAGDDWQQWQRRRQHVPPSPLPLQSRYHPPRWQPEEQEVEEDEERLQLLLDARLAGFVHRRVGRPGARRPGATEAAGQQGPAYPDEEEEELALLARALNDTIGSSKL